MSEPLGDLQDRAFAQATAGTAASYRRLSATQLAAYLDRRVFAVVGSTRADGHPHLRGTPWLTLVIAEGDHGEHIAVIIEGSAAVVAPPGVPADVRAAATGDWISAWIRLTAQRATS
jgi:hypothetical protein